MQTKVEGITKNTNGASVSTSDKDGKKINFDCDVVLISVGRKPNTNNLNLEAIGVELDEKKRIITNKSFQTNVNNVYAIGDVIDGPMLAHKAEDEGIAVAENIAGHQDMLIMILFLELFIQHQRLLQLGKQKNN